MKYQQCGHIEWSCITTFHELSRVRTMCGTGSREAPRTAIRPWFSAEVERFLRGRAWRSRRRACSVGRRMRWSASTDVRSPPAPDRLSSVFSPGSGTWLLTNIQLYYRTRFVCLGYPSRHVYAADRRVLLTNPLGSDRARIGSMTPAGTVSTLPCPVSRPDGRARGVEDAVEAVPRRGLPYGF